MLTDSELPKSFWAEALATTSYLRNQSPTKAVEGKTPYEAIYGVKPRVGQFLVVLLTHMFRKMKDRNWMPRLIGVSFWVTPQIGKGTDYDQSIQRMIHSQDVRFNELVHGIEKESSTDAPGENPQVIIDCSSSESSSVDDVFEGFFIWRRS